MSVQNVSIVKRNLNVALLKSSSSAASINEISFGLDCLPKNLLNQIPWPEYNYLPRVYFALAHGPDCFFLKYYVNEKFIRAVNTAPNTDVYEDSCVEFFICFEDDPAYYNFEFNCIGTALAGYGKTKSARVRLPDSSIRKIKYQSAINNDLSTDSVHWELTIAIPFNVFCHHKLNSLSGKKCRANFYKCGDHLPMPHYVTWSDIVSPEPDFHLPGFFGTLEFA